MRATDSLRSKILRFLIPERIPWFAAHLYDRIARTAIGTYYKEVADDITSHIREGIILDIGTGPGYLPIEIAKRHPRLEVLGIDASGAMVSIAQGNVAKAGLRDRVRFLQCSASRLRFDDDSFDLVLSTGSMHAWKHPEIVIDECFRVLKPGGEAWLLDPAQVITPEALKFLSGSLKPLDRLASWWGSSTSKLTPPYSVEEAQGIIRRTKFETGTITEGKWLTIRLKKDTGRAPQ